MKAKFLLWLQEIQFRLLLWALGWRMNRKSREDGEFKKHLSGKDIVLQFQTADEAIARHFVIKHETVQSFSGIHYQPSTTLSFASATYAVATIMNRDPMAFMKGMQEQKITAAGDMGNLMWFMGAAKHLK